MGKTADLVCAIALAITCIAYGDSGNSVCSSPPDVDGAVIPQFTVSEHPIGTAVIYNCPPGYPSLDVSKQISLCRINTENGKAEWTFPNITCNHGCEIPKTPGGSFKDEIPGDFIWNWKYFRWERNVTYTTILSGSTVSNGTVLWFYCDEPYSVNGNGSRKVQTSCLRGRWTTELQCLLGTDILCPPIRGASSFTLQYSNHRRVNSTVTFFCKDNSKRIEGSNSWNCLPNGTWSGQTPNCVGMDILCPSIDSARTFTLQYTNHRRVNSIVTFFCKDNGKKIEGSSSLNCLPNGTWSGRNPKCVEVTCEEPQPPKHGTVRIQGNLKVGSLATYSCDSGRMLNGDNTAKCLISGQWTFDAPECLSVAGCVLNLDPFSRLLVEPMKDVYRVGETISLSCPRGERMSSAVYRIMCLPGGWTNTFPNCV